MEQLPERITKSFGSVVSPIKNDASEFGRLGVRMYEAKINGKIEVIFDKSDILEKVMLPKIQNRTFFKDKAKDMKTDIEQATKEVKDFLADLDTEAGKLRDRQERLSETTKKVSGQVRDSAEKLGNGLKKIEAAANFDKLERMTVLLERAADAMERLNALQQTGRLDKILEAIK